VPLSSAAAATAEGIKRHLFPTFSDYYYKKQLDAAAAGKFNIAANNNELLFKNAIKSWKKNPL